MDEKTRQFFDDLQNRLKASEEEAERRKRENRTVNQIRKTGNILKNISNLVWTVKGAPSQELETTDDFDDESDEAVNRQRERMMKAYE